MRFPRRSGILCHITSLPSQYGIGDLGPSAFSFVDFLQSAGQRIWQILPLGPPAHENSPYSCYSAFAANPLLISLQPLVEQGLLSSSQAFAAPSLDAGTTQVDFSGAAKFKLPLLETAFDNFNQHADTTQRSEVESYCRSNALWLDDFGRFEAFIQHFRESDWTKWPDELVKRTTAGLAAWDQKLAKQIQFSKFKQFLFDRQWNGLKSYANSLGIDMYGDMPIFVAHQSADVWANQDLFCLDELGQPTWVAGVPPDYFSETGQLWGNPQYRWDVLENQDYRWWTQRFARALKQFDLLRVDHFRGFESYWEIPASAETAVHGTWKEGPGAKVFNSAAKRLGPLPLIAEDLGLITDEVNHLREALGFPGMRVLQFGFDRLEDDLHRPSTYIPESVAYTGTHDNDTVMGWYKKRTKDPSQHDLLSDVITSDVDVHLQLINAVLKSASDTAVVPVQDLLGLGNQARMNMPGLAKGNWGWKLAERALTPALAQTIKTMTVAAGR